jgi:hypothetical protein
MGAVAKSYMRRGFLIYEEMRKYLVIFEEAISNINMTLHPLPSDFPYIWGKFYLLVYQCSHSGIYDLWKWKMVKCLLVVHKIYIHRTTLVNVLTHFLSYVVTEEECGGGCVPWGRWAGYSCSSPSSSLVPPLAAPLSSFSWHSTGKYPWGN